MFMVVGLCSFSFNINYDDNKKVIEKHDIKPKGAISADGFSTSTTYNLNASGNSTTHYIQNLPISVGTRSGSTQVVTINAPYTIYSATQYIYGHTDVSCSSGTNTSSTNDVTYDVWEQLKTIADPKLSNKEELAMTIDSMEVDIYEIQDDYYRLEIIAYKIMKYIDEESGYIYKSNKLKHKKKTASMCLKELNNYKNYPYSD